MSVVCLSNGTAPETRLIWYRDNRQVDISFSSVGNQIRNEYEYTVRSETAETLECRLEYPPIDLRISKSVTIYKQGTNTNTSFY